MMMWKKASALESEGERPRDRPSAGVLVAGAQQQRQSESALAGPAVFDCSSRDNLSKCGPVKEVVNLSSRSLSVQAAVTGFGESGTPTWFPLVSSVKPFETFSFEHGAVWLPKQALLRGVDPATGEQVGFYGTVGDGTRVVQQASD